MYRTGTASPPLAYPTLVSAHVAPPRYLLAHRLLHSSPHLPMQNSISFLLSWCDFTALGMRPAGGNGTVSVGKQGVMLEVAAGLSEQGKGSLQSWSL